ncbi:MAG: hypothetical protein IIZ25_07215 [Thermoguttaceae bacterium]|nr:hypothetical protein [Thermoguttaceae bacterium]
MTAAPLFSAVPLFLLVTVISLIPDISAARIFWRRSGFFPLMRYDEPAVKSFWAKGPDNIPPRKP